MLNCPGRKAMARPASGASDRVVTSSVSRRRPTTRCGTGVMAPARRLAGAGRRSGRHGGQRARSAPVEVEQPDPGRLQALEEDGGHPLHEGVAQGRVGLRLGPQAGPVDGDGPDRLDGPGVEVPPVGRDEPAPADDGARARRSRSRSAPAPARAPRWRPGPGAGGRACRPGRPRPGAGRPASKATLWAQPATCATASPGSPARRGWADDQLGQRRRS